MNLTVLIVDDEPLARRNLELLLAEEPEIRLVGSVGRGDQALALILKEEPDLVLLDIKMAGMSGLELVEKLVASNPHKLPFIVFVTAYDCYAVQAFEQRALDYLVKPFRERRFRETMNYVRQCLAGQRKQDLMRLARNIGEKQPPRLVVERQHGVLLLDCEDLIWVEAADHYLVLHTFSGTHITRKNLSDLELELPGFLRVHRSTLVNPKYVVACRKPPLNKPFLQLRDGTRLEISRRRWRAVQSVIGQTS